MLLLAMRHGAYDIPPLDKQKQREGIEPPLNQKGISQVKQAAAKLKSESPISVLFSSPTRRALESAEILGKELGLPVNVLSDLRSIGSFGRISAKLQEQGHQDLFHDWLRGKFRIPYWETLLQLVKRIKRAVKAIKFLQSPNDTVLVVTHGEVIIALNILFKGLSIKEAQAGTEVKPTTICKFTL